MTQIVLDRCHIGQLQITAAVNVTAHQFCLCVWSRDLCDTALNKCCIDRFKLSVTVSITEEVRLRRSYRFLTDTDHTVDGSKVLF